MPSDPEVRKRLVTPGGIAHRLRAVREAAGLSQDELAVDLGLSSSRVSRVETGILWAKVVEVRGWAARCGLSEAAGERLVDLLEDARASRPESWGRKLTGGHLTVGREVTALIAASTEMLWFEMDVIPGMLQTEAYARPIIANTLRRADAIIDDSDEAARERAMQSRFLADPDKRFRFLVGETALYLRPVPVEVMVGQLHSLQATIGLSNVWFGIVPAKQPIQLADVVPQPATFFDERVLVEAFEELRVIEDAEVYRAAVKQIEEVAVTGNGARQLILEAIEAAQQP